MSRLKLSRNSGFSTKIGTIPPNSGRTLCKGFWGIRGHAPSDKIRNLRSSNCWKYIEIVNLTITVLFLYHFKYFTIPSGGPFWFLGACMRTPPCLRACYCSLRSRLLFFFPLKCLERDHHASLKWSRVLLQRKTRCRLIASTRY